MTDKRKALFKHNKTILVEKIKESLLSTLPIVIVVFLICFTLVPMSGGLLLAFFFASLFLVVGMGLFTLGADISMSSMGEMVGASITKSKKLWLIVLVSFVVGCIVTVAEPDLLVLAEQFSSIPNIALILSVAVGVGIFLVVAMLRVLFRIRLSYILIGLYITTFILAFFVPKDFLSVSFDAGGVTTGPMTVPFILSFGIGVGATRSDKNAQNDSFGLVALCSIGPILAVMVLGLIFTSGGMVVEPTPIPPVDTSFELGKLFVTSLPKYLGEIAIALSPIIVFFLLYNFIFLKLKKQQLTKIFFGLIYTFLGLVIFMTSVNVGFLPVGTLIGKTLGAASYRWVLIPLGALIGYFIVAAEPAVHVLSKQVYEITSGAIPRKALVVSMGIGVSVSIALAMLRTIFDINLLYFLLPGYAIALILTFFVPQVFTAIGFDSGGVASGPMTATFLLPLAVGATSASGGNAVTNAFGLVALVAMTPIITVQVLGIYFKVKTRSQTPAVKEDTTIVETVTQTEDIIDFLDEQPASTDTTKSDKASEEKTKKPRKNIIKMVLSKTVASGDTKNKIKKSATKKSEAPSSESSNSESPSNEKTNK